MALAADWLGQMFFAEGLHRLREVADVRDPVRRAAARTLRPLLTDATAAITGWGTRSLTRPCSSTLPACGRE